MWGPLLSLLLGALPCADSHNNATWPAELRAQIAVASARGHMGAGQLEAAQACLQAALRLDPNSTLALRTRAQLLSSRGLFEDASRDATRAAALGDADPEFLEFRAVIEAGHGNPAAARAYAAAAGTWKGDLIGASLQDGAAAYRGARWVEEATPRGALAALVLAGHAARSAEPLDAFRYVAAAQYNARIADVPRLKRLAVALQSDLQERASYGVGARIRVSAGQVSNPTYASTGDPDRVASARLATEAEVVTGIPLGGLRLVGVARIRQHALLARRSRFSNLDLTAYSLGTGVQLPLGPDPRAVVLGFMLRWTDVFADAFRFHYAAQLEGGPSLKLHVGPRMTLDLAFYGVYTDFIDTSPTDSVVSSVNRDRVGQRLILGWNFGLGWLQGRVDAMFVSNDAQGDAFDMQGGVLGLRFEGRPQEDLGLFTAVSVGVSEYGPVGDRAVIGSAATRAEVRSVVRLGAQLRLLPRLELIIEDTYVNTAARAGHGYTYNVLSVGVQTTW